MSATVQEQEITKSPSSSKSPSTLSTLSSSETIIINTAPSALEMTTTHTSIMSPVSTTIVNDDNQQSELASMTNVNVLDLHKNFVTTENDASSSTSSSSSLPSSTTPITTVVKDNPIYVYTTGVDAKSQLLNDHHRHNDNNTVNNMQHHHRISPIEHMIDDRIITDSGSEQLLTKLTVSDDQILRLVAPNGETQQIISREIINGEHHILTRNENGEHIITRIVSADTKFGLTNDDNDDDGNGISYATTIPVHHKIITDSVPVPDTNTVYISNPDGTVGTSSIHYDHLNKNLQHHIFTTTTHNGNPNDHHHNNQQQHHHHHDHNDSTDENDKNGTTTVTVTKEEEDLYGDVKPQIFEKPPLDLIYEDGAKTVIYTTTTAGGEQKGMEIYAGSELGIIGPEGHVMVPGGLQYTTQQINGQTVFVVADTLDGDLGAQLQR